MDGLALKAHVSIAQRKVTLIMTNIKSYTARLGAFITAAILLGTVSTAQAVPVVSNGDLTNGVLQSGAMAVDSLLFPAIWDFWTFNANAGDNITVTGRRIPTGSNNDPVIGVWFGIEADTDEPEVISGTKDEDEEEATDD